MSTRSTSIILVAAGQGERLAAGVPKALAIIAEEPLLVHSVRTALSVEGLEQLVIAAPDSHLEQFAEIIQKVSAELASLVPIKLVAGGESRQQSIAKAVAVCDALSASILVHDVARALAPAELFERVADAVIEAGAGVIPVMPVVDTIKLLKDGLVEDTVDRSVLGAAQTPQGFPANGLRAVYANAEAEFTDDAALYKSAGGSVIHIQGDSAAFKVTTQEDLRRANALFERDYRTGIGTDTHRFSQDPSVPLFLGTVLWEGEPGLEGHSDGDAVSHAIVDAVLSAASLGDIGSNFGVDRVEFEGANGAVFLREAKRLVEAAGYRIENVSVQLIGDRPKVAPKRHLVQVALTEILDAPVSLSATTTDGLGFLGNSEGVAAVATAMISRQKVRL
jgi:2-C-methyl-D-erythritol 4-phosphate cytidylyltransferase/2-C-methyl-D-erythritol 2,4-cyclodiphosphate synthase